MSFNRPSPVHENVTINKRPKHTYENEKKMAYRNGVGRKQLVNYYIDLYIYIFFIFILLLGFQVIDITSQRHKNCLYTARLAVYHIRRNLKSQIIRNSYY